MSHLIEMAFDTEAVPTGPTALYAACALWWFSVHRVGEMPEGMHDLMSALANGEEYGERHMRFARAMWARPPLSDEELFDLLAPVKAAGETQHAMAARQWIRGWQAAARAARPGIILATL